MAFGKGMASAYYRIRRWIGLPPIAPERQEREILLHPENDWRESLQREDEKRLRGVAVCLLGGLVLAVFAGTCNKKGMDPVISRPEVGEEEEEAGLVITYDGDTYEIPLTVESRRYTDAEWVSAREAAWEYLQNDSLGNNTDWSHIREDLNLPESTPQPGISVTWDTSDPELIDYNGRVTLPRDKKTEVILTAVLQCEERSWEGRITAILCPGEDPDRNSVWNRLSEQISLSAKKREDPEIDLPEEVDGIPVLYQEENSFPPLILVVCGCLVGTALWLLPEQRKKEEEKQREKELMLSYPELVAGLTVLMGAGLTVRGAWERMVMNYRRSLLSGRKKRAVYEEMSYAWNSLGQGTSEEEVYREFGKRCRLPSYLRLANLLESNLRKGSRGLLPLMKEESEQALEERLRTAKKLGEEASSKLLLPMMLLFSLVLVILMIPAMLSFG